MWTADLSGDLPDVPDSVRTGDMSADLPGDLRHLQHAVRTGDLRHLSNSVRHLSGGHVPGVHTCD